MWSDRNTKNEKFSTKSLIFLKQKKKMGWNPHDTSKQTFLGRNGKVKIKKKCINMHTTHPPTHPPTCIHTHPLV